MKQICSFNRLLLFLFGGIIAFHAQTGYAQAVTLSLNLKNKTLKEIFNEIETKSEYIFFYYDEIVDTSRKLSIEVQNQPLEKILDKLFAGTTNTWSVEGRQIFISQKEKKQQPPQAGNRKKLTGQILDENGEPLIGASVIEKGTKNGAAADIDGRFTLEVSENAILQINYLGYQKQEITVAGQSGLRIVMKEDMTSLDEVVVVAYGTQKKVSVTAAISTVGTKELKQSPSANFATALSGRLPGLTAMQTSGQPGREYDIYLSKVARNPGETSSYSPLRTNQNIAISLSKGQYTRYYMNYQASLNYLRTFGRHDVGGLFLFQRDNWMSYKNELPFNVLGLAGRLTYGYDNRYLTEFNIGYNGSEQFAPGNRFGTFPAYSVGWIASNEKFLKDNPILTYLKFRASYGITGNDKMIGEERFLYQSVNYMDIGPFPTLGHGQGTYQGYIGNEHIQWEKAEKKNFGLELEVLGSITLTADAYTEYRDKILIKREAIPALQGIPLGNIPRMNMGIVENKGFETELVYMKIFNRDLSIILKGNFAYNKNIVKYADEVPLGEDYAYPYRKTGFSVGQPFGWKIDYSNGNGYINTQEELNSLPAYDVGGIPRPGDFKYVNVTPDNVINERDQVPIGYPEVPRISCGFSGALNCKNIDFSFLFTGIAQSSKYFNGNGISEFAMVGFYSGWHRQAWTPERYANGEEIRYPALGMSEGVSQKPNDVFIMDCSFLRLKNLEIGYSLSQRLLDPLHISKARMYVNGNNLLTWKKLPVNTVDPEQTRQDVYPLTRMFNIGINIVF
jgi:hypothetical protein